MKEEEEEAFKRLDGGAAPSIDHERKQKQWDLECCGAFHRLVVAPCAGWCLSHDSFRSEQPLFCNVYHPYQCLLLSFTKSTGLVEGTSFKTEETEMYLFLCLFLCACK